MGLANINIRFSANLRELSTQLQNAQRQFQQFGSSMQDIGKAMSLSITAPLVGIGVLAMKSAADLEQLKTSLNTVFKGDYEMSEKAFDTIQKFATETPYGLEEVTKSFIKLKNLGLDASEESLRSYGNTASAMSKSLDQMIEAVADASVGEFERLKEFGIKAKSEGDKVSFTFQGVTTTVGKNANEITEYLKQIGDVNFAGGMDAQSKTFNGQLAKLKDAVQITMAEFGQIMNDMVGPLIAKVAEWVESFQTLDPAVKKAIVVVGGIVAALGPVITAIGGIIALIPTFTAGLTAIGGAFTAMTGPIGLAVAAIAGLTFLVVNNWDSVKKHIIDVANYFIDLYNSSIIVRAGVQAIILQFKNLFAAGKFVVNALGSLFTSLWNNIKNFATTLGALIKAIFTGNFSEIPEILRGAFSQAGKDFKGMLGDLKGDWNEWTSDVKANTLSAINDVMNSRYKMIAPETKAVKETIKTDVSTAVVDGVNTGVDQANKSGKKVKVEVVPDVGSVGYYDKLISSIQEAQKNSSVDNEMYQLFQNKIDEYKVLRDTITGELKQAIVEGSEGWYEEQISQMEEQVKKLDMMSDSYRRLTAQIEIYKNTLDGIKNPIKEDVEPEQGTVDWYNYHIDKLEEARGKAGITIAEFKRLGQELDLMKMTFKLEVEGVDEAKDKVNAFSEVAQAASSAIDNAFGAFTNAIVDSLGEAENGFERFRNALIKNVLQVIAASLSQALAQAISGAVSAGAATGPGAVVAIPTFIASMSAAVIGAFAAIPKFANGGIVSGPTLGLMGEYAGAANNPEVIAPLNKLKELIEPASGGVTSVALTGEFRINGNDLVLALDRTNSRNRRLF